MKLVAMIDAGFLIKAGCGALGIQVADISLGPTMMRNWCSLAADRLDAEFMRMYWYDAIQESQQHPDYDRQKRRVDDFSRVSGIQVRLGSLVERANPNWSEFRKALSAIGADFDAFKQHYDITKKRYEQKGVDTLLVLDMVKLAQNHAYDIMLLIAGDADLVESVRTVQEHGRRVVIARPASSAHCALFDMADEIVDLTPDTLKFFLQESEQFDIDPDT